MAELTPKIADRIDSNCAAMATAAYQHCVEVYPEKGPWDGEDVRERIRWPGETGAYR